MNVLMNLLSTSFILSMGTYMNLSRFQVSLAAFILAAGTSTFFASSASAFANHEHVFHWKTFNITEDRAQDKADTFCRQLLTIRLSKAPYGTFALNRRFFWINKPWHIWAHLSRGACVANQ